MSQARASAFDQGSLQALHLHFLRLFNAEGQNGGRMRYSRGYFIKRCYQGGGPVFIRAEQRGYSQRDAISMLSAVSAGVNESSSTASPGALVQSSQLILRWIRRTIALCLCWEGGLPTSWNGLRETPSSCKAGPVDSKRP